MIRPTGNKDFTIRQTADGIEYESKELKITKNVFRVAKKEKTDEGYLITSVDGHEYEVNTPGLEYNEDDIKLIKKGSVAGFLDTEYTGFLVCGYSTDFIEKEVKRYFGGADETPAYPLDTIESKLEEYEGQDPAVFLEEQIEYFLSKRAGAETEAERVHYQRQLDVTGRALSIHRTGQIRPQGVSA